MSLEVILQDDRRRHGIEPRLPLPPVTRAFCQQAFSFAAAEPFIRSEDWNLCTHFQRINKGGHASRLIAWRPIKSYRQADDDSRQPIVFCVESCNFCSYLLDTVACVSDHQRPQRTREGPRDIADRQPDSSFADVHCQNTHD